MKNDGFVQIILIAFLLVAIILASFYFLKLNGGVKTNNEAVSTATPVSYQPTQTTTPKSDSTDTTKAETELDSTDLNSLDSGLDSLNSSANSI